MNITAKTVLFWAVIVISAFLLWQTVKSGSSARLVPEISYSDFLTKVASGEVSTVTIAGNVVNGVDAKSGSFGSLRRPTRQRCWMLFSSTA